MYPRKYSLKTRYNFRKVYKYGQTVHLTNFVVKFLTDSKLKRFAVVTSNRFCKKAVVQNKTRRLVASVIRQRIEEFPNGFFVFIPKQNILTPSDKIIATHEEINSQIDSLLSKLAVVRSG